MTTLEFIRLSLDHAVGTMAYLLAYRMAPVVALRPLGPDVFAAASFDPRSCSRVEEPRGTPMDSTLPGWRQFLRFWFLAATVRRALRVAVVVAPVLVLINHAEALAALEFTPRLLLKISLTFLVPYAVSSYSSARALIQAGHVSGSSGSGRRRGEGGAREDPGSVR